MSRKKIDYLFIFLKGIAMGAADVVPGVSGGTIAFISGIYQELIDSISKINFQSLKILTSEGLKAFWKHINGNFFLALLSGIAVSIFSLAKVIKYLLENEPIGVWSFFFGLMLASVYFLAKDIEKWNISAIIFFILAGFIAYYITIIPPLASNSGLIFLFFAGALAICAMILPGISGAFILVLLGAYHIVLQAIDDKNLKILAVVGAGAVVGILSFSKLLKWLFEHKKNLTMAALTGFIVGSLNKVWPWKQVLSSTTDAHGNKIILLEKSVLPSTYEAVNAANSQLIIALAFAFIGFFTLYGLEKWASKLQKV